MANELRSSYTCTMQELYSKCELAWNNCKDNIADFTAKKAFYTTLYCDGKIADVAAARLLPEDELRQVDSINLRNEMIDLLPACLDNNQDLKSYIKTAFPKTVFDSNYNAAGGAYYPRAANKNWENVVGMNDAMVAYITLKNTELLAGNNMPATFKAKVIADALAFKTKYDAYLLASETGILTNNKIKANNLLDADYKTMLDDGKNVYRHDETKADLFTDEKLMAIISPPGSASLTIEVLKGDDDTPAEGAQIILQKEGSAPINLTTDAEGIATLENADPGVYKMLVKFAGYEDAGGPKEINKGVNAHVTITLNKL